MNIEKLNGLAMAKINESVKITEEEVITFITIRLVKMKLNLNLIIIK
jgi:hypothetical protein